VKQIFPRAWYSKSRWVCLLYPFSLLYFCIAQVRRYRYKTYQNSVFKAGVPVIVIGNITTGGTGKTPLTIALTNYLLAQGRVPAILTRGYQGKGADYPLHVTLTTPVATSGDEALLLALNTPVPVVVDPQRARGVKYLQKHFQPDVILCDDGLQHYALARDMEIAVVDGMRGFGNCLLLPAGPLREPPTRLTEVDFVIVNGTGPKIDLPALKQPTVAMTLRPTMLVNLVTGEQLQLPFLHMPTKAPIFTGKIHAVAGIGNPERFFQVLQTLGLTIITHEFSDHHQFIHNDFNFGEAKVVIMTEKDAVKCMQFATKEYWYLKVEAQLPSSFLQAVHDQLTVISSDRSTSGSATL
jgi:tetraacyldisaccharide 4'-kinase